MVILTHQQIYSISPNKGPVSGGTPVVIINGANFTAVPTVTFGGNSATGITRLSDTQVQVDNVPAASGGSAAIVDVIVCVSTCSQANDLSKYTYYGAASPTLSSLSPSSGTSSGGTPVTITGSNLLATTLVKFGSTDITNFTIVNDNQVIVTSPSKSSGPGPAPLVRVVTPVAPPSNTLSYQYYDLSPSISSISPNFGSTSGGTPVTITGSNFYGITTAGLIIGGTSTTKFTVYSDSRIDAIMPAHTAGVVDITAVAVNGTSGTLSSGFTYYGAPTIDTVTPSAGKVAGGDTVTITGSNFFDGISPATVTFGGVSATSVTVVNSTTITAITPDHAAGLVDVVVQTDIGPVTKSNAFEYVDAPTVTAVSPPTGKITGGYTATITGTNFYNNGSSLATATFGGESATNVSVVDRNTITVTVPAHAAGEVDVAVQTDSGTGTLTNGFTYRNTNVITATSGANGSINPSGSVSVINGNNQTFTMIPDDGYKVASVIVDGISVGAMNDYTFANVTADHTISVNFISVYQTNYSTQHLSHGQPQITSSAFAPTLESYQKKLPNTSAKKTIKPKGKKAKLKKKRKPQT